MMKGIFEKAGFKNVEYKEVKSKLNCGTVETYWEMLTEVAAPVVGGLSKADDEAKKKIKDESLAIIKQNYPGHVAIDCSAWVFSAEK
jgi:hypothetical protein